MKKALLGLCMGLCLALCACGAAPAGTLRAVATPVSAPLGGSMEAIAASGAAAAETVWQRLPKIDRAAEHIYQNHPELTPVDYDSPALLPLGEDRGQAYMDSITFICDSPTYWLWPFGLLNGGTDTKQIWTGEEWTLTLAYLRTYPIKDPYDGALRLIPEAAALHKPPYIILALGVNGISFMDEDSFTAEYAHLIESIQQASPDTVIILQSMYPITTAYRYWGDITNATISAGNRWILGLAEQYHLRYLDTFSALLGEDGNGRPELYMSDGLHPDREGLSLILDYIRTHGYLPYPEN